MPVKKTPYEIEYSTGTIERLSSYLNCLVQFRERGHRYVSSKEIGMCTGVNPAEVRRDLLRFGTFGKKGLGYPVDGLIEEIRKILGSRKIRKIALAGAGNLGTAIANYEGLRKHGFKIAAIFDNDPKKIGEMVGGVRVQDVSMMEQVVKKENIKIGIIATPSEAAQEVADTMIRAGIRVIINYSDVYISAPRNVQVHNTNPVVELLHTLYYLSRSEG